MQDTNIFGKKYTFLKIHLLEIWTQTTTIYVAFKKINNTSIDYKINRYTCIKHLTGI